MPKSLLPEASQLDPPLPDLELPDLPLPDLPLPDLPPPDPSLPVLVFDGGCPFCRHFAELSELRGGIPGLQIRDGRADHALRRALAARGQRLADGAMVLEGGRVLHGAAAIARLCGRMQPSAALLALLVPLLADRERARGLYPLLLLARRLALAVRRLPVDPDRAFSG